MSRTGGDRHRGTRIQFWVPQPAREVERWRAAAKARGVTLSVWLRDAANRAAVLEKVEQMQIQMQQEQHETGGAP